MASPSLCEGAFWILSGHEDSSSKRQRLFSSHFLNSTLTHSCLKTVSSRESPGVKTSELSLISPVSPPHLVSQVLSFLLLPCLSYLSSFHSWSPHPMQVPIISCLDHYSGLLTELPWPGSLLFHWQLCLQRPVSHLKASCDDVTSLLKSLQGNKSPQLCSLYYFP